MKPTRTLLLLLCLVQLLSCRPHAGNNQQNGWLRHFSLTLIDTSLLSSGDEGALIRYGRELMLHTAAWIGPTGSRGHYTGNSMNCTNCHQDAGTRIYSFDLLKSYGRYPQYRPRENKVLTLSDRINNCVTRPLIGQPIPDSSREMKAFLAYFRWLDQQAKGTREELAGRKLSLVFPERPADPVRGATVFASRCARCHGSQGEGIMGPGGKEYLYPALWGKTAYQSGSSMHRNTVLARWLKANMPFDSAAWYKPVLSDEECLDLAAFINDDSLHERPHPESFDYPDAAKKPIDYGKGPFIDTFPERQHTLGPFLPILRYWNEKGWKPTY